MPFNSYLTTLIKPPNVVFDQEQYEDDLRHGRISIPRNVNNNNTPYLPSELKAVHGASSLNTMNAAGKKKVVIATTIANNFPPDYIQKCFNTFSDVNGLTAVTEKFVNFYKNIIFLFHLLYIKHFYIKTYYFIKVFNSFFISFLKFINYFNTFF